MNETPLLDWQPARGGSTFSPERDGARLSAQHADVWAAVKGGEWLTLAQISARTGHPEASVSARLRDLRKPQFGGHTVQREYVVAGLFRYRLVPR